MKAKCLPVLFLLLIGTANSVLAREEWFRGLELENALARSDLVIVARVSEVSESTVIFGGKAERALQQFKFAPVRTLKGVFARDVLSLTNNDLGDFNDERSQLERGQVRLLMLGRSGIGYTNHNYLPALDQSLPPLHDENDPFLGTVKALIAVTQEHDRAKKVRVLVDALGRVKGAGAVPLLTALQRRALLAAQVPETTKALARHLSDPSPAVREAAARAFEMLLEADYLDHPALREGALAALTAALDKEDATVVLRVAAVNALGSAGAVVLRHDAAARQLNLEKPRQTFAERVALLRAIGQLKMPNQRAAVTDFLEQLPLDAPAELQVTAELTLVRLDAGQARQAIMQRLQAKYAAGLDVLTEIRALGKLPASAAAPALLEAFKLSLNLSEKHAFAGSCSQAAHPRLVPALGAMLDPRRPALRRQAVHALEKIDTVEAARVLRPHLREEADLLRKLQIAEFLGRHGIRDGYPYAIEHMSEPHLLEGAVAALVAIREPKAAAALRDILKTSNDVNWDSVAIRALGALGDKDSAPRFLEIIEDLKNPLAAAALIALGDLGEPKTLAKVREGLASRNDRVVLASVRTAGKLLSQPRVPAEDVHDRLASLFADADATQELRSAALDALLAVKDPRLDRALSIAVRDAGLEETTLIMRTEQLMRERKVKLLLP